MEVCSRIFGRCYYILKSLEEHFEQLDYVLSILRNAGATLKLSKCRFFQSSVDYLGHVVYPGKLAVAQKIIDTLAQAHHPSTCTELKYFLGMSNVFRKFVSGLAKIAAPLTDMLRKGEPDIFDELTEAQALDFSQLKNALINPPILKLPREGTPYTLDVDACDSKLGACLQQEQPDGTLAPCGFYSRILNQAEKNYCTPKRESLAMVWAMLLLRPNLERKRFYYTNRSSSPEMVTFPARSVWTIGSLETASCKIRIFNTV
jgi:RNase H-like domain found in reverse transcriptase